MVEESTRHKWVNMLNNQLVPIFPVLYGDNDMTYIDLDIRIIQIIVLFFFFMKTYVVDTYKKPLGEMLVSSTCNIRFTG